MKITWNDIKEKYLEFHKMDSFTENMAIDIDFGYWLMQEYASQQKTVSDEDEITFERLPDNSCIITVKGINELGEEYIRQSTIAYPIYCALINRLESNNSQQKPKEVDWDELEKELMDYVDYVAVNYPSMKYKDVSSRLGFIDAFKIIKSKLK